MDRLDRRQFISRSLLGAAAPMIASCTFGRQPSENDPSSFSDLDGLIQEKMERDHIPGVAACIVKNDAIAWSRGYGWANIEKRIAMSIDHLQNIGSISKTFTTTALMQLWEKSAFDLNDDVNDYLSFPVTHPVYPDIPITFRLLMTHRSSLRDGSAYPANYACGDPRMALGDWVRAYLAPDGEFYNAEENFNDWEPGKAYDYCNVAYGLLAHLVERLSDTPFGDYCRTNIFQPLEMSETSWYLADIDTSKHVIPYVYCSGTEVRRPHYGGDELGVLRAAGASRPDVKQEGYLWNCLYNHPNYPDGFLRTSVRQISRYLRAYLNQGEFGGRRILQPRTITEMLTAQVQNDERIQGLTWYGIRNGLELVWGHGGRDPGINNDVRLLPSKGIAVIAFTNTNGANPREITGALLDKAQKL